MNGRHTVALSAAQCKLLLEIIDIAPMSGPYGQVVEACRSIGEVRAAVAAALAEQDVQEPAEGLHEA